MVFLFAGDVANYVREHTSNEAYVFEANPGLGILSKALLEAGIPRLRVFVEEENLAVSLKELTSSYPDSLEIVPEDIMLLPKLEVKDYYQETDRSDVFYRGIQKHSWQEAPPVSLVAVAADVRGVKFMRSMLAKISVMSSLFSFGRCQFFPIISEKEYMYITAEPTKNLDKYRAATMMYNIFFDIKFIREIPGSCLSSNHLPPKKKAKWEASNLYFSHFIPKADMFDSVAPIDRLPELYYFIRHHMSKRTDYVIPALEKCIPSCGPRLIFDGMKFFTRFGDLSPSEMLRVFQLFSSWPEYEESTFKHIAQQFFDENLCGVTTTEEDEKLEDQEY